MTMEEILTARNSRYGTFAGHAAISQTLKRTMQRCVSWDNLPWTHKESLEMIAHKIARILNGDSSYKDSWVDIEGYAKLISDTLEDPKE